MDSVKLDRFGRVLIPKKLRDKLGITAGEELELVVEDEHLVLRPERNRGVVVRDGNVLVFDVEGQNDIVAAVDWQRAERSAQILFGGSDD